MTHPTGGDRMLRRAMDSLVARTETTLQDVAPLFPFVANPDTGQWETTEDGNWCAGHWIGLLWLAHEHSENDRFSDAAREYTDKMQGATDLLKSMFGGMNYLYAGFRAYDVTGDREQYGLGLTGADAMVDLFDERARQIPVGQYTIEGPAEQFEFSQSVDERTTGDRIGAVDMIYTSVPVLWRAFAETGNTTFRDVAVSHCDRHLDWYLREDGRTWQEAEFEPETGNLVRQYNDLAHGEDTCWARGQGWNIAGLAAAYSATFAERYLTALETTTDYYIQNSPDDHISYWDFADPNIPDAPRDTSSAALVAYGLTALPEDDPRTKALRQTGFDVLESLLDSYLIVDPGDRRDGMLLHGCYDRPGDYAVDNELVWSSYYLACTIARLLGEGLSDPN